MEWKESKNINENVYNLPGDWLKIEYFEALNILFRIENSLRIFVYIILKNQFKDKWKDLSAISDDADSSTIGAIAKKRLTQDKNYAYLGYVLNSPLLHLTSGELIRIITSDSYWKYFKEYFLGTREIIKNKLDEIGNVRNSLAHFRPIKKGDIDLVKQNSIHTLSVIEKTIQDLINCPDTVPTNTDELWYKELITIGIENINIAFRQSINEKWIKLIVSFEPPKLSFEKTWNGYDLKTLNIKTDKVLTNFPHFSKYIICATESLPYLLTTQPQLVEITKQIRFTFSKDCLRNDYAKIKSELETILLQAAQELELITQDNLARGKLIEAVNCRFDKHGDTEYYSSKREVFQTSLDEESPVEFWGTINSVSDNYLTNTDKYPWMPIPISDDKELPF